MLASRRRQPNCADSLPFPGHRRGGFTLVEMLVSVTLVLLMMLMFAEIYGLAQETISKQRGIAENDQRARILAQVLRQDIQTRTFRDVYPFKLERVYDPGESDVSKRAKSNFPITDSSGMVVSRAAQVLEKRRGYFSFSENDPTNDIDDYLQFTIDASHPRHGHVSNRLFGKATPMVGLVNGIQDGPDYDDARLGDDSGSSPMAEVSYFLRHGNLYRSVLLIRNPYLAGDNRTVGAFTGTQGRVTPDGFPSDYLQFWKDFDYSAYREPASTTPPMPEKVQFHGPNSLINGDEVLNPPSAFGALPLHIPRTLAAPMLRFGHSISLHGQPLEFSNTVNSSMTSIAGGWDTFSSSNPPFGRLVAEERAHSGIQYPGMGFAPFDSTSGIPANAQDPRTGVIGAYQSGARRGVDLIMPNVHAFDIQAWDDILGRFVDIGYGLPDETGEGPGGTTGNAHSAQNPYDVDNQDAQWGFYHISRLRKTMSSPADPLRSDSGVPQDYGNRFDTWCPDMWIYQGGTNYARNGRAPYRPMQRNRDPNTTDFNDLIEPATAFADNVLDRIDSNDDAEAPLRAIRIVVRYIDPQSGQTRQVTIDESLID